MGATEDFMRDFADANSLAQPEDNTRTMTPEEIFMSDLQNQPEEGGLIEYATNPDYRDKVHEGANIAMFGSEDNPLAEDMAIDEVVRNGTMNIIKGAGNAYIGGRAGVNAVGDFVTDAVDVFTGGDIGGFEQRKNDLRAELPENSVAGALGDEIAQMYLGGKAGDVVMTAGKAVYGAGKKLMSNKADEILDGYVPAANVSKEMHSNRYRVDGDNSRYSDRLIKKSAKVIDKDMRTKTHLPHEESLAGLEAALLAAKAHNQPAEVIARLQKTVDGLKDGSVVRLGQPLDGVAITRFDKAKQINKNENRDQLKEKMEERLKKINENYKKSPEAIAFENVIQKRNHEGIDIDPRIYNKNFDRPEVRESDFLNSYEFKRMLQMGDTKAELGDKINKLAASKGMAEMAKDKAMREGDRAARIIAEKRKPFIKKKIDETVGLQQGAPTVGGKMVMAGGMSALGHVLLPGAGAMIGALPIGAKMIGNTLNRIGRNTELKRVGRAAGVPDHRIQPYLEPGVLSSAFRTGNAAGILPSNSSLINAGILGNEIYDAYQPEPVLVPMTKKERNVNAKAVQKKAALREEEVLGMEDGSFKNIW